MVSSEQRKEVGDLIFSRLQDEVYASSGEELNNFVSNIALNNMGFDGKEGIDEDQ